MSTYLQRIQRYNPGLRAYLAVSEQALEEARNADRQRAVGSPAKPLAGIPIAVKDLFDTESLPTTYGGLHFRHTPVTTTATVVRKLQAAGAIVIGKTNLHEYAYGTTSENAHYGNTVNPWNRAKIPGGSSGGSSAALTAGLCTAALGTDTGGSIRIPAALTGHVGLKPTFGLVSKAGVFPLASSLDHVGPMTKSVSDAALLLEIMAGYDPLDQDSVRTPDRSYQPVAMHPHRVSIGVPKGFFFDKCHSSVLQVVQGALQQLQDNGFQFREVTVYDAEEVPDMQTITIASEAFAVHRIQLQKQPSLYGADVRQRLEGAKDIPGYRYVEAQNFRQRFRENLDRLFETVDVLVTPTTPLVATDVGQTKAHIRAQEVNIRGHLTRYTNPWNLSGYPAITLPCGLSSDGLPVGLQVVGSRFSEHKLLSVAKLFEDIFGFVSVAPDYR